MDFPFKTLKEKAGGFHFRPDRSTVDNGRVVPSSGIAFKINLSSATVWHTFALLTPFILNVRKKEEIQKMAPSSITIKKILHLALKLNAICKWLN